jgi:hypothetical protein
MSYTRQSVLLKEQSVPSKPADNTVYETVYMNSEQIRIKVDDSHLVLQKEVTLKHFNISQIISETDLSIFLLQDDEKNVDYQHFAFANSIMNFENNEKVITKQQPFHV